MRGRGIIVWAVALIGSLMGTGAWAQAGADDAAGQFITLPPLKKVVDMAIRHAPSVRMQDAHMNKSLYNVQSKKRQWMDGLGVDMQLGLGNQALIMLQPTGTIDAYRNFNNGYRAAFNVRVSAYDLLGRKSEIKMAEYESQEALEKKEASEQEVEMVVITRYYAVQAAQGLLRIKSEAKQTTQLHRQMAEKEFAEGSIAIAELSRVIEISSKAAAEYEVAKQYLYENIKVLETLTGQKLY
ncbi:TolC family protein [Telluribacter sp. SYSU D00476]|uniref:TolC family protein n=1 Tax=Telluribacter sp. SYSU D00476 TaxID=2811430 RepID=UPI001FF5EB38|nr:TolC family protein [Telluribacter sp. SYSU D00476]